jgi:hypothetical protein
LLILKKERAVHLTAGKSDIPMGENPSGQKFSGRVADLFSRNWITSASREEFKRRSGEGSETEGEKGASMSHSNRP